MWGRDRTNTTSPGLGREFWQLFSLLGSILRAILIDAWAQVWFRKVSLRREEEDREDERAFSQKTSIRRNVELGE